MTTYRYLLADLLTNQILAELPLTDVNFTQQLNSAGTFTGTLLLSGADSASLGVADATVPARTAVYVDRDGILVWGGIVWYRTYSSDNQRLQITGREFESYFERRRINQTISYYNADQFAICQSLVSAAQSKPNGNIGVAVGAETSGILITRQFYGYEYKPVFNALLDLSRSTNGFDFNITVAYDGSGLPTKTFELLYPRSGQVYSSTDTTTPVYEFPGNMISYEYPEDGSLAVNYLYSVGAGSNEGKIIQVATDATKLAAGWPLLEDLVNYSDINDSSLIANLAQGQLVAQAYPPTTMKIVATPYNDPTLGSFQLGDDARIRITDERFPTGLDAIYRIVAINVDPGEKSGERITLTLTLPNATS